VLDVFCVREAVGTVLARLGASASSKSSFATFERAVRLATVTGLTEMVAGLGFTFGDTDERGCGADTGNFLGVILIPVFSPPRVSISTTCRRLRDDRKQLFSSI
jgi:hypothetical protein